MAPRMLGPHGPVSEGEWTMLSVGDVVEDFEALDHLGDQVLLSQLLETGPHVIYFYIKAKTPG